MILKKDFSPAVSIKWTEVILFESVSALSRLKSVKESEYAE